MDEQPENVASSLLHSISTTDQTDALFSLSDSVITDSVEAIKESDLLSHFPITREIVGLIKAGFSYRDRRFISKLLSFLGETSKMSQEEKDRFIHKLDMDPAKAQEAGEAILDMIGKVIRAYGDEEALTYELMLHMCEIIQRAYLSDLQHLATGAGYNESNLESVGVIKPI